MKPSRHFDVVVIDTLARTSAGLEENSAKDMGVYMNNCYKIRDAAQEAANAAKEGGFLGFHATRVSEGEQRMLDKLGEALAP